MRKLLFPLILLAIAFFGGVYATNTYFKTWFEPSIEEQSEVLLEKIKTVQKMVTVEGEFAEIFTHKKDGGWTDVLGLFDKKMILKVQAKVLVGYDMKKMRIEAKQAEKVLRISPLPAPEILAIETDASYYDIQESTFSSFSEREHSAILAKAKNKIAQKAQQSSLMEAAEKEGVQIIDLIKFIAEDAGWKIVEVSNDKWDENEEISLD